METNNKSCKKIHHGHAIKRLRHTLGIKQEALAMDLHMTQQAVSLYEQKPQIDDEILSKFATALKVSPDLIKELEEDPITVIVENNTFEKGSVGNIAAYSDIRNENFGNTYNPIDKILEISNEKQELYQRLLQLEQEKSALLEMLLKQQKEQ